MKTVIEMALHSRATVKTDSNGLRIIADNIDIEKFYELIRADAIAEEREACAKVCDEADKDSDWPTAANCAATIRARSNK